jgi:hypothetical protein
MTRSASVVFQGSEFNEFLFAPIGEDRNGMLLTVLSALARRGVDPWQEAAELALLPGETATQRLVSLISTLTDGLSPQPDVRTIAAHLIARLPRRARSSAERHGMLVGVGTVTNAGVFIALVIFMAFTLGAQYVLAHHQSPVELDNAHTPASGTPVQKAPLQTPGK